MELLAAILALHSPGYIRILTDSQALASRHAKGLATPVRDQRWAVMTDGDLWSLWFRSVHARGVASVQVEWIPGHATREDIDQGRTTSYYALGNERADSLAKEQSLSMDVESRHILDRICDRWSLYASFVHR
eukprot:10135997-Alexandrium_andersonii.AAC.1